MDIIFEKLTLEAPKEAPGTKAVAGATAITRIAVILGNIMVKELLIICIPTQLFFKVWYWMAKS